MFIFVEKIRGGLIQCCTQVRLNVQEGQLWGSGRRTPVCKMGAEKHAGLGVQPFPSSVASSGLLHVLSLGLVVWEAQVLVMAACCCPLCTWHCHKHLTRSLPDTVRDDLHPHWAMETGGGNGDGEVSTNSPRQVTPELPTHPHWQPEQQTSGHAQWVQGTCAPPCLP